MSSSPHTRPRVLAGIVAASLAIGGGLAVSPTAAIAAGDQETVIVELDASSALARVGERKASDLRRGDASISAGDDYRQFAAAVSAEQNSVLSRAASSGVAHSGAKHVTGVLNAVITKIDSSQLDALRAVPGVKRVTVDSVVHLLEDDGSGPKSTATVPVPSASGTPKPTATVPVPSASGTPKPTPKPTPTTSSAPAAPKPPVTPQLPGTGTTVAILDTGVDYTLPDLGAGFGEGHKVVGGYDFVNNDADPMDDHYHGTHVAGIIGGSGVDSVTGVAPGALITAYKVMDAGGSGTSSDIILGMDAAADPSGAHPADIINMSLGGSGGVDDPITLAADAVSDSGVLVVAAAGNSGPTENTIGTPGIASKALTVGASITDLRTASVAMVSPTKESLVTERVSFSANPPARSVTARIVDVGRATDGDLDKAGDLRGAVVVYEESRVDTTGEFDRHTAERVESRGAIGALIYEFSRLDERSEGGLGGGPVYKQTTPNVGETVARASGADALKSGSDNRLDTLVAVSMTATQRDEISAAIATGKAKVTISSQDANDTIASFSSRGLVTTAAVKPEVVAPGFDIRSTVPSYLGVVGNAYRLSGTSMATPYVAGSAAVALAAHPNLGSAALRDLMIGSASKLASSAAKVSPVVEGAGRVTAAAAVAASVLASPATLAYGQADVDKPAASLDFEVTNATAAPLTATLSVLPSEKSRGTLTLSTSKVRIAGGDVAKITAKAVAAIDGADSELSGEIEAKLSDGTTLRVPYLQVSRHLSLSTTPQVSTGDATVMMSSFLPLDAPPVLTVTPPHGRPFTVKSVPTTGAVMYSGYFQAHLTATEPGVYTVVARGTVNGSAITGTGTAEVATPTKSDAWKQVGHNSQAESVTVSTKTPGVAIQTSISSARPYVTTDHGATWKHVASIPVADGYGKAVADPSNGRGFWYFLRGSLPGGIFDPTYQAQLLYTPDLGVTWKHLPLPDKDFSGVTGSGQGLVVTTDDGIEVSSDAGKQWKSIPIDWPDAAYTVPTPDELAVYNGALYYADVNQIMRIDDIFGRHPSAPTTVYTAPDMVEHLALGANYLAISGLSFISTSTTGSNWTEVARSGLEFNTGVAVVGDDLYAFDSRKYAHSTDRGATWTTFDTPVVGAPSTVSAWPDRKDSLLLPMENVGLYSSDDKGAHWKRIGISGTGAVDLLVATPSKGKSRIYVADANGVLSKELPTSEKVTPDTLEWGLTGEEGTTSFGAKHIVQDARLEDTFTRVTVDRDNHSHIEVSTDGAKSWAAVGPLYGSALISDLVASPTVSGLQIAAYFQDDDHGLLVTHDNWSHWDTISSSMKTRGIAFDPAVPGRLWLAGDDGLFRTDDEGHSATKLVDGDLTTVWVDPSHPSTILAGGRGLWRSSNGGKSFTKSNLGGDTYIGSFTSGVDTSRRGHGSTAQVLFAGSMRFRPNEAPVAGRGVLASLDGGRSWTNVSAGIGTTSVLSLASSPDGAWLYAGVLVDGIFRAKVSTLVTLIK